MTFTDLTDTFFNFQCTFSDSPCDLWEYDFYISRWDDRHCKNLSRYEIEKLRENCKRILEATDGFHGGK